MFDVMDLVPEKQINCLDYGHVRLIDLMPRICPEDKTADFAIVQAARVSYGDGTKSVSQDNDLVRYLMRHNHNTPLEMVVFKFHCKMPIFVARQWIRHRMCSVNEISARYSIMKDEFYKPDSDNIRFQSAINKQGSEGVVEEVNSQDFLNNLNDLCEKSYQSYEDALNKGVSREQARMQLPVNLYTEWYWKIDLHNLLHFLALRCDHHAQLEIRVFAEAILKLISPVVPNVVNAWNDYHDHRGAMKLTKLELEAIKASLAGQSVANIQSENKGERREWLEKVEKLGLKII